MLDQKQTITINEVAEDHSLITFDGMRTERVFTKTDGTISTLTLDHSKGGTVDKPDRHLCQLVDNTTVYDSSNAAIGTNKLTVNITVSQSGPRLTPAQVKLRVAGLIAWFTSGTNAERVLAFES